MFDIQKKQTTDNKIISLILILFLVKELCKKDLFQ